jgi:hypothetical protein
MLLLLKKKKRKETGLPNCLIDRRSYITNDPNVSCCPVESTTTQMVQVPFSFPLRPRQPAKKKRAKKIYIRERKVIIYIHTSAQEIGRRRREKGCVYLYYYIDAKTVRMGASFFLSLSLSLLSLCFLLFYFFAQNGSEK